MYWPGGGGTSLHAHVSGAPVCGSATTATSLSWRSDSIPPKSEGALVAVHLEHAGRRGGRLSAVGDGRTETGATALRFHARSTAYPHAPA